MPSTHQTLIRMVSRGFNQATQRHLVETDSAWDLLNLHPVNGRLEQTPWLYLHTTLDTSYFTVSSPVRLLRLVNSPLYGGLQYFVITESNPGYIDIFSGNQFPLPVVLQTAKPANDTITGQCLLYGIKPTNFGVAFSTVDVKIDSGTTFQYRFDSGGWSASITIQPSYQIHASGLTVAFQGQGDITDYTGYTIGNTWSWGVSSLPVPTSPASTSNFAFSSDVYGNDVYIGGVRRNILRLRNDMVTSVGYSKVFGMHVAVFFGHLFVSHFAQAGTSINDPYDSATTPFTIGWSHLNNPDQFFSTLINEADSKLLPQQQFSDLTNLGITGLAPWRSLLFVFLADSIWNFQYVGLPNVMQASQLNSNIGSIFRSGVIRTPQAIYFVGRNDFYKIDEFEPAPIGRKVRNKFFTEICPIDDPNFQRTFGFYNSKAKEVVWTYWIKVPGGYQVRQVVYNEQTDDWYFRNMPCAASGLSDPYCGTEMYNTYGQAIYGYTQVLYADQPDGVTTGALADTYSPIVGTGAYTEPYFETPYLNYGNYFNIKQSDSLYIDASILSTSGKIRVHQSPQAYVGNGNVSMTALGQYWVSTLSDQRLSLPRQAFRSNAYKFQFTTGVSSTAVYGSIFNFFQEFFIGPNNQIEK
jgi:hypothetical protein